MKKKLFVAAALLAAMGASGKGRDAAPKRIADSDGIVRIEVLACEDTILRRGSPDTEDIKYGFEGGRVVKIGNTYHMITSEMVGDPYCVRMRTGYWTSENGTDWRRRATIRESDADFTGASQRAAIWGPMMVYHKKDKRWHLFYVCYKALPQQPDVNNLNFDGVIQHAVSDVKGIEGIGGPYTDREILMRYDENPDPWEGHQGVDSFFPYRIGKQWYALYGSATTQQMSTCRWMVGMARADRIEGPWTRMSELNPVGLESFAENPIVMRLENGVYIAIVDGGPWVDKLGYTLSWDGVHWSKLRHIDIEPVVKKWWTALRTPISLIKEKDGTYTMFFTAFKDYDGLSYGVVSKLKLKLTLSGGDEGARRYGTGALFGAGGITYKYWTNEKNPLDHLVFDACRRRNCRRAGRSRRPIGAAAFRSIRRSRQRVPHQAVYGVEHRDYAAPDRPYPFRI